MLVSDLLRVGERHPPGVKHEVQHDQEGQYSTPTKTRLVQRASTQSVDLSMGHFFAQDC